MGSKTFYKITQRFMIKIYWVSHALFLYFMHEFIYQLHNSLYHENTYH